MKIIIVIFIFALPLLAAQLFVRRYRKLQTRLAQQSAYTYLPNDRYLAGYKVDNFFLFPLPWLTMGYLHKQCDTEQHYWYLSANHLVICHVVVFVPHALAYEFQVDVYNTFEADKLDIEIAGLEQHYMVTGPDKQMFVDKLAQHQVLQNWMREFVENKQGFVLKTNNDGLWLELNAHFVTPTNPAEDIKTLQAIATVMQTLFKD